MRLWAVLAVCAAVACGGQVSGNADAGGDGQASSSSGSSSSGSGGGSGGSGGPVDLCPPDPPTVGVSCVSAGLGCAYRIAGCEGYRCTNGRWQMDPTVTCP